MPNLRSIYHLAEERTRFAILGLGVLLLVGVAGVVFLSPSLTLALVAALGVVFVSFVRPTWTLFFLMVYLPFEPFLLKWVPDDVYVYARYSSELLVYLLVAVVAWKVFSGTLRLKRSPIDVPFAAFLMLLVATTLIHFSEPVTMVLGARQILRFVLLYFVTVQLAPSMTFVRTTVRALIAIVAIQIVLGLMQAVLGAPMDTLLLPAERRTVGEIQLTAGTVQFWDPGQRVFGTLGRYDQLGTFMAFVLLLVAAWLYEHRETVKDRWVWGVFLAALPVLALTYSRSAWFGFLLGFLFIAVWAKRDRRILVGTTVACGLLALYLAISGLAVNRLIDVADQSFSERFFEAFSAERWRGEYYGLGRVFWIVHTVISVVPSSPLFGHGPASYGAGAVAALKNTKVYDELGLPFGVYGTEGYIDNNWFSLWGETGTLGLVAYLWMYVTLFLAAVALWREGKTDDERALGLGVAAAMVAISINAFLATYLEARTLAPYLWVFAGLVTVVSMRNEHKKGT